MGSDFGELFQADVDALYRLALRHLRHPLEAEDAVQDVFLRLCRRGDDPGRYENPRAWMFRVLISVCIDRKRAQARRRLLFDGAPFSPEQHADQAAASGERHMAARDALRGATAAMRNLPEADADALALVAIEGMTYAETAEILGVPIGTVRSRISRSREALRAAAAQRNTASLQEGDQREANVVRLRDGNPRGRER